MTTVGQPEVSFMMPYHCMVAAWGCLQCRRWKACVRWETAPMVDCPTHKHAGADTGALTGVGACTGTARACVHRRQDTGCKHRLHWRNLIRPILKQSPPVRNSYQYTTGLSVEKGGASHVEQRNPLPECSSAHVAIWHGQEQHTTVQKQGNMQHETTTTIQRPNSLWTCSGEGTHLMLLAVARSRFYTEKLIY